MGQAQSGFISIVGAGAGGAAGGGAGGGGGGGTSSSARGLPLFAGGSRAAGGLRPDGAAEDEAAPIASAMRRLLATSHVALLWSSPLHTLQGMAAAKEMHACTRVQPAAPREVPEPGGEGRWGGEEGGHNIVGIPTCKNKSSGARRRPRRRTFFQTGTFSCKQARNKRPCLGAAGPLG